MKERSVYDLQIDEELRWLIYPISNRALRALEESIINDGCCEAIKVWNHTILDGHNRYLICANHNIPYKVEKKHFKQRTDVLYWLCDQQLLRNDLPIQMRWYLIGMQYEIKKPSAGMKNDDNSEKQKKARSDRIQLLRRLGRLNYVSGNTVERYAYFARCINKIRRNSPNLARMILSGDYNITHAKTVEIAHMNQSEMKSYYRQTKQLRSEISRNNAGIYRETESEMAGISVKDVPAFDPDAEIVGLALTIPSWLSSLERVRKAMDPSIASEKSKQMLSVSLHNIKAEIENMLSLIA